MRVCPNMMETTCFPGEFIGMKHGEERNVVRKKEKWYSAINIQVHLTITLFLILLQTLPALGFFIDQRQSPSTHEWSYGSQHDWRLEHKQCGQNVQSPIDIQRRYVMANNQLKLHFYNYNQVTKFKIQNAHHTIKLNPIDTNQQDSFGFKLKNNIGEGGFNSSLPEIITADEEIEPEFENRSPAQSSATQHYPSHQVGRDQSRITFGGANQTQQVPQSQQNQKHHHQQQQQQQQQNPSRPQHHESSDGTLGQPLDPNNIGSSSVAEDGGAGANSLDHQPYNGAPTIKLDWLDDGNNEYKLRDIHFHWGERRDNGSEHAIDGRRAAMEMHLVHIKNGLDKSKIGFTSDSVTVIAVLIESYRKSNADFNPIVNALNRINMTNQAQEIEYKSIYDLLPNILTSFYTYSGSLTTPPCYQVVNWIVMSNRLYLNAKQIEMFRNLYSPSGGEHEHESADEQMEPKLIMPNIRQIQPLNNRTILASFSPFSRLEQIQVANSPYNSASSPINFHLTNTFSFSNGFHFGSLLPLALLINLMIISMHLSVGQKYSRR